MLDFADDVIWVQQKSTDPPNTILTLKAEVTQWKNLSQSSSQGLKSSDSAEVWKLKNTVRDRTASGEGDGRPHQLGVAGLQNIPQELPQEKSLDVGSIIATPSIAR